MDSSKIQNLGVCIWGSIKLWVRTVWMYTSNVPYCCHYATLFVSLFGIHAITASRRCSLGAADTVHAIRDGFIANRSIVLNGKAHTFTVPVTKRARDTLIQDVRWSADISGRPVVANDQTSIQECPSCRCGVAVGRTDTVFNRILRIQTNRDALHRAR